MLLMVRPKRSIAMTAATSDSGRASSVMTAARHVHQEHDHDHDDEARALDAAP